MTQEVDNCLTLYPDDKEYQTKDLNTFKEAKRSEYKLYTPI